MKGIVYFAFGINDHDIMVLLYYLLCTICCVLFEGPRSRVTNECSSLKNFIRKFVRAWQRPSYFYAFLQFLICPPIVLKLIFSNHGITI